MQLELKEEITINNNLNREFPESYYMHYEQGISRKLVDEVLEKQYKHIVAKLKKSVPFKLQIVVSDNEAMDVINDALVSCVKSYEKNQANFKSQRDFFAYWLLSSWREFRNQNKKKSKMKRNKDNPDDLGYRESILIPLELLGDFADGASESQDSCSVVEEDYFNSEDFKAYVHEKVYEYLDDCYLDNLFTLRDITIFKIYCVNNYSIMRMVHETSFSRTSIITALSKIKKHLATVDFRWQQFQLTLKEA
jgi:hypothetical protein